MRKMRTAEEMAEYEYETSMKRLPKREYFRADNQERYKTIVKMLEPDEYVLTFFWGYIYIYIYIFRRKRIVALYTDQ